MAMKAQDFLDYIRDAKSKSTNKNYKVGLKAFSKWYGKSLDEILEERFRDLQSQDPTVRRKFNREIEKFHRHLKNKGFAQNTTVIYIGGIRALFRYFDMDIKSLPTEVTRKVVTTKDFVPTVQQYRDMFNSGTLLDRVIISMSLDLGWRVGDFIQQKRQNLPNLDAETPIPYESLTEKEEIVSKSFLSEQSVNLLRSYLKTLKKDNPYLFQSNGHGHITDTGINKRIKVLAEKTKIQVPSGKRLRFHAFRKRFLSECANLKIDINTAKILVGKSVSVDMLTYLSEVEHKKAFQEVHERLRVSTQPQIKAIMTVKQSEIDALKQRVEELEILNRGLIEILKQAKPVQTKVIKGTKVFPLPLVPQVTIENIKKLGKQALDKEREEYKKLIENNNNNNH